MRKLPKEVTRVVIYPGFGGFRYTCRDETGKVVYDSPRSFQNRRKAREQVASYWPDAKVTFDLT